MPDISTTCQHASKCCRWMNEKQQVIYTHPPCSFERHHSFNTKGLREKKQTKKTPSCLTKKLDLTTTSASYYFSLLIKCSVLISDKSSTQTVLPASCCIASPPVPQMPPRHQHSPMRFNTRLKEGGVRSSSGEEAGLPKVASWMLGGLRGARDDCL